MNGVHLQQKEIVKSTTEIKWHKINNAKQKKRMVQMLTVARNSQQRRNCVLKEAVAFQSTIEAIEILVMLILASD